jgi:hypothetical protein
MIEVPGPARAEKEVGDPSLNLAIRRKKDGNII